MKRLSLLFEAALLAAFLSVAFAAGGTEPGELAIAGPDTAVAGQPVTLTLSGVEVDINKPLMEVLKGLSVVRAKVNSPAGQTVEVLLRPAFTLGPAGVSLEIIVTPPVAGVYVVTADLTSKACLAADKRLTVTGAQPNPDPDPKPDPDPQPTPDKFSHVYLIYDRNDADPSFAAFRDAKSWKDEAKTLGIEVEMFTDLAGAKAYPGATTKATTFGLPCLVLFNGSGTPAVCEKVPSTVEAMTARIRKAAGK